MACAKEFRIGYFGDVRRERAGASLFEGGGATGSLVLNHIRPDRAKVMSVHRFLGSAHVTPAEILDTAGGRADAACVGRRIVAAQDTTEINFPGRTLARGGLGPGGDGKTPGFFCHAMVAIDVDEEAVLGVVTAQIWARASERVSARRSRAIEDKESMRWIEVTSTAADQLAGATQLIVVSDRESDIYSHFVRRPPGVELILRVAQNRKLIDAELLFDAPTRWSACGTMEIHVPPSRPGQTGRTATL